MPERKDDSVPPRIAQLRSSTVPSPQKYDPSFLALLRAILDDPTATGNEPAYDYSSAYESLPETFSSTGSVIQDYLKSDGNLPSGIAADFTGRRRGDIALPPESKVRRRTEKD